MHTPQDALAKAQRLYDELLHRRTEHIRLDRYHRGEQPLVYASSQFREFHADRYAKFSDNWCGVVAASPAERIRVDGFRVGEDTDVLSDVERQLWRDWMINEMDAQSSQGFLSSIVSKRSAVMVWGDDDDEPVMTWERGDQVAVSYDPTGRTRRAAIKSWADGSTEYLNLYTPDEVWKWERSHHELPVGLEMPATFSGTGSWKPREVEGESWPARNPLGLVPIVEFPNRPILGGQPMSDIEGTIAMQDAINLLWAYLFTAADHASMPARVVMGQEPPKVPVLDENGQKIGEKPVDIKQLAQGRMLWLTGQNAKIGQWDPAKLDVFTAVINTSVRHIAAQTRTPVHYIVGELTNVNGETLIAGEAGLVKKVEEFQLFAAGGVREVFRLAALVRGNQGLADQCRLGTVQWANPQTRSGAQLADQLLKLRQIGFPFAYIAESYGLSQTEVARLLAQRESETNDPTVERLLRDLQDNGTPEVGDAASVG